MELMAKNLVPSYAFHRASELQTFLGSWLDIYVKTKTYK